MKKNTSFFAFLAFCLAILTTSCYSGTHIKDVDFPATPVSLNKITKIGEACFSIGMGATRGHGSVILAAKNGGLKTIYMVEYATKFEAGGLIKKECVYAYGD